MPDAQVQNLPEFAKRIVAVPLVATGDSPKRLDVLKLEHAEYAQRKTSWQVLLDAFEGSGGFLDGSYLWEYRREDGEAYTLRRKMARYHNYLEALVDIYVRFVFTMGVTRSSTSEDFNAWLTNVDGHGLTINDLLKQTLSVGLVHGHSGVLVDMTADLPTGQTKADEKAKVIASVFTALAIPDWRFKVGALEVVKLREAPPEPGIDVEMPHGEDAVQYLLMDPTGWARFNAIGELVGGDVTDLGLVPLVVLRPKRSYLSLMLGRALVGNANIIRGMFNRSSEEDEVIRQQAFSVLMVEVPQDGNVAKAKEDLGTTIGSAMAIVVRGKPSFQTPDQNVPTAIRDAIAYLVQELFRLAHVRFKRDSLDAESAEAIRLQHAELNEMLNGCAQALAQAERDIARAYFAWKAPTKEQGAKDFDAANVEAKYPDEYFLGELIADLEAWAEAIRMDLGLTMSKRLKKKAVRRLDSDIPQDELTVIDKEIDAQTKDDINPELVPLDKGVVDDGTEDKAVA